MGTFQPEIEIWNLDVLDALYPHAVLGKTDFTNAASVAARRKGEVRLSRHESESVTKGSCRLRPH